MHNNLIYEGPTAEQYTDPASRIKIAEDYRARWQAAPTPSTHPALFDPLAPPQGWRYDPYYECWLNYD